MRLSLVIYQQYLAFFVLLIILTSFSTNANSIKGQCKTSESALFTPNDLQSPAAQCLEQQQQQFSTPVQDKRTLELATENCFKAAPLNFTQSCA